MTVWYYSDAQRNRLGPVAADDLAQLHDAGQLAPEVLVWREGLPDWRPWSEVMDEVLGRARAAAGVSATGTGAAAPLPPAAPLPAAWTSADAGPAAPATASPYSPPRAVVDTASTFQAGGHVVYAGFWKRAAASIIDSFVVGIGAFVIQMGVMLLAFGSIAALGGGDTSLFTSGAGIGALVAIYLLPIAMQAVYFAWFHAGPRQATLGKMAVGIKVTDDRGQRISFGRGIGRYFATWLSALLLCIGYILAAFTDRKRALHDMVASTLVVDQWAFTRHPERQRTELGTVTVVILVIGGLLVLGYFALIAVAVGMAAMGAN